MQRKQFRFNIRKCPLALLQRTYLSIHNRYEWYRHRRYTLESPMGYRALQQNAHKQKHRTKGNVTSTIN